MKFCMVILVQMSKCEFRYLSVIEQVEKNNLCQACVHFLRLAASWSEELHDFSKDAYFMVRANEIFSFEEQIGDPQSPIRIEDTLCVSNDVMWAMTFLRDSRVHSYTNTRLMHRMAAMLEGPALSWYSPIMYNEVQEEND